MPKVSAPRASNSAMPHRNVPSVWLAIGVLGVAALSGGCSATGVAGRTTIHDHRDGLPTGARRLFDEGLASFAQHDRDRSWTVVSCAQVADKFIAAEAKIEAETHKRWHQARYNAGVAMQRCADHASARKLFAGILAEDPMADEARVQLARMELAESKGRGLDKAISEFFRAVLDSDYQNVEALVELARAQMARDGKTADSDGADDLSRASKNLRRALAVDDQYMPAANQLAIFYLVSAKKRAGVSSIAFSRASASEAARVEGQALDMALLVASQAATKAPSYAPIHNTLGVIATMQQNLTAAAKSFDSARKLDPGFFEAHMNYASVNLAFRGFDEAEQGYRTALRVRPDDYEAMLGLALALRARGDGARQEQSLKEAEALLLKAKKLENTRPEAYFNLAVLAEEYGGMAGDTGTAPYLRARALYQDFVKRAAGRADLNGDVDDVVAKPKKPDNECMGPAAKQDKDCKRGRLFDIATIVGD